MIMFPFLHTSLYFLELTILLSFICLVFLWTDSIPQLSKFALMFKHTRDSINFTFCRLLCWTFWSIRKFFTKLPAKGRERNNNNKKAKQQQQKKKTTLSVVVIDILKETLTRAQGRPVTGEPESEANVGDSALFPFPAFSLLEQLGLEGKRGWGF